MARTLAAIDQQGPAVRPSPSQRRWWPLVVALAAGSALALPAWVLGQRQAQSGGPVTTGERQARAQETIRIGSRAVLVAEAGAQLRWRSDAGGGALVQQGAGDVFYRVNAGRFRVETPFGQVQVQGTCFRVEVKDMKLFNRQNLSGAAVGAALGAAVVVTVYEGRVLLAKGADQVALGPGQTGELVAGTDRESAPRRWATGVPAGRTGVPRFDQAEAQTEALRARVAEQDRELARLRAAGPESKKMAEARSRFLDPSKEDLLDRAQRCELRWDSTPSLHAIGAKDRARLGLSETEVSAMNEALKETADYVGGELRRLYVEISGDQATADKLSPETLPNEIFAKSPEGARPRALQQLSRELAGLAPRPADLARTPVAERTFRVMMNIGEQFERRVAERLGPARARDLRSREDGWRSKSVTNGCE